MVRQFFARVQEIFSFLEEDYGYQKIGVGFFGDLRDPLAYVRYQGQSIGVEVAWGIYAGAINITFIELNDAIFPSKKIFFGRSSIAAKAIELESLVGMQKAGDLSEFLLGDSTDVRLAAVKKRAKIIEQNLPEVLENLKNLSLKYAVEILRGNSALFEKVMAYYGSRIGINIPSNESF
jgi:hypothetical protein